MEIDNENIWNVLNNLTSALPTDGRFSLSPYPRFLTCWGYMRMAPNYSYLYTIEKCFDCSFRMGFPFSKQNCRIENRPYSYCPASQK